MSRRPVTLERLGTMRRRYCSSALMPVPMAVPPILSSAFILRPLQADDVPADGLTVGAEFLPQTDGDRVLHLGASHLDHPVELLRLLGEGGIQPLQLDLSTDEELEHCHLSRRGKNIVGGLPIVHMIIGIHQGVVPLSPPSSSMARLAMTSLAFMLRLVPAPPGWDPR